MQGELNFDSPAAGPDGLAAWRQERERNFRALARANGLPLGHPCRVELCGDVVLEGELRLADVDLLPPEIQRDLNLRLQVGRCIFTPREIVSLVRLD